jgi:conjugative relaxase-like TrwC/TraI family protein
MLGLEGKPELVQLERLLKGLHPLTGEQLTARLADNRIQGTDFTARLPKGCTTAIEGGDERIALALVEAGKETMADLEQWAMTRVRKGKQNSDRITGNWAWLMVEHPETRPAKDDGMSDWDRHLHFIVPSATWDAEEKRWKALKVKEIFEMRKYFSHAFDLRMTAKLAELGYNLDIKYKRDKQGGMKYLTWDIKAAPGHEQGWQSINDKNSRRNQDIEETEKNMVAARKARDPDAPDELSALAKDKLASTTRLGKNKNMTLDGLRAYWDSRITPDERAAIAATIDRARKGLNPKPESKAAEARAYAIAHHFYRNSVVDFHDLVATAIEKSMGAARMGSQPHPCENLR